MKRKLLFSLSLSIILSSILLIYSTSKFRSAAFHSSTHSFNESLHSISTLPLDANQYLNTQKTVIADPIGFKFNKELLANQFIGNVLIIKNNKILLENSYGYSNFLKLQRNNLNSHFEIGSIQKNITATMIAELIQQRKLSFDSKLSQFFPMIPNSQHITIKDMLTMTSGLELLKNPQITNNPSAILSDYVHTAQLKKDRSYKYTPINYNLLAGIIQIITHQSYWQYFSSSIKHQAKLDNTNYYLDWYTRVNHTLSYSENKLDHSNYHLNPQINLHPLALELGTGNIDMTIGDLYWYLHEMLNNHFFDKTIEQELLRTTDKNNYSAGLRNEGDHYQFRGIIIGQQSLALTSKDGKDMIILMSNESNQPDQLRLINTLFSSLKKM